VKGPHIKGPGTQYYGSHTCHRASAPVAFTLPSVGARIIRVTAQSSIRSLTAKMVLIVAARIENRSVTRELLL
jgi:hypothetical protein